MTMLRRPTDARTGLIAVADCLPSAAGVPAPSELSAAVLPARAGPHPAATAAAVGATRRVATAGRRRLALADSWGKHAMDVVGFRSGRRRPALLLLLALVQLPW